MAQPPPRAEIATDKENVFDTTSIQRSLCCEEQAADNAFALRPPLHGALMNPHLVVWRPAKIHSLKAEPHLNDKWGFILRYSATRSRFVVRLEDHSRTLLVSNDNLLVEAYDADDYSVESLLSDGDKRTLHEGMSTAAGSDNPTELLMPFSIKDTLSMPQMLNALRFVASQTSELTPIERQKDAGAAAWSRLYSARCPSRASVGAGAQAARARTRGRSSPSMRCNLCHTAVP